jgi:CBS domain containing-hemolysin-like protein
VETVPSWEYVAIGICVLFSGFFSASETALTALSEVRAQRLVEERKRAARGLRLWLARPTRVLTTILIGNNLVNVAASALATDVAAQLFAHSGLAIAIGVITFIILVFGEVVPKNSVRANPERYAMFSMQVMTVFYVIAYPVTLVLNYLTRGILHITGGSLRRVGPSVTEAEIEHMVKIGQEEGEIERHEKEIIQRVFEFSDMVVREAMVARTEMISVNVEIGLEELRRTVAECGHSRIPVYRERMDDIVGVLYAKDLLAFGMIGANAPGFNIAAILHEPYFVPETMKISELLSEFRRRRVHLAVVVDEYGGTSGIITLEDVLEELVGDIRDEFDEVENLIVKTAGDRYEADARIELDDLEKTLRVSFPEDREYETLGGFVTDKCGCVPDRDFVFEWNGHRFTVLDADPVKVERIRIEVVPDAEPGEKAAG